MLVKQSKPNRKLMVELSDRTHLALLFFFFFFAAAEIIHFEDNS
jgi:hypothetical protein